MVSLIYKTRKNGNIPVYFDSMNEGWIMYLDLGKLYNTSQDKIDEIVKNIELSDTDKENIKEYYDYLIKNRCFNIYYVLLIGKYINEDEANDLIRWYKLMTEEYDSTVAKEFNDNLLKALGK